jgi:hypothetical protein
MPVNCTLVSKHYKDLLGEIEKWSESNKSRSYFKDPYEAAFKLVETEFNMDLNTLKYNPEITAGQVGSFRSRLRELTRNIDNGKMANTWASTFWQSSKYGKKDPVVGNVLNKMGMSGFHFRANEARDTTLFQAVLTNIKSEAGRRHLTSITGWSEVKVEKELNRLDTEWMKAIADYKNNVPGASDKITKIKTQMDELVRDTHLKVYDDLINILESTKEGSLRDVLKNKYLKMSKSDRGKVDRGEKTVKASKKDLRQVKIDGEEISDQMYGALENYMELSDGLYKSLRQGVDKRIDSIIKKLVASGRDVSASEFKNIKERLKGKLMPKYEQGFFPHYSRDLNINMMDGLMPKFEDMQTSINDYSKSNNKKSIKQIIKEMNGYIDGHAKSRARDLESGEYDYDYSRNFVNSITNYITDINRFNFASFMDAHMIDGLMSIERIYKTEGAAKGYAESITNFLQDLNMAANGHNNISENTRNFMRTLLGFEFISKLGFNPRGALRNTTQRFLDYVNWGPIQINSTNEYLRTLSFKEGQELFVENELKKAGLLFDTQSPEFMQTGLDTPASIFRTVSWNDSAGKFQVNKPGKMKSVADKVSWLAGKSSYLHRTAENINRKHTFKIGYGQMHKWLSSKSYYDSLVAKRSETEAGKKRIAKGEEVLTEAQFQAIVEKKSANYAINMVVMNHFDYADYAKAKWTRSKIGRFAGQFQHYSFEFLERNIAILREAKHDVVAGKLLPGKDAQGLMKAYRMSMAYFFAPLMASELMGVDFSNLIEHDTLQRLKQLTTLFTGDDEEIQEAFYGKGPIISTFGGPLLSDTIDIGVMLDLIDLDEPGILTLISGLENYDPSTSTEIGSKLRILNTFLGRAYERHYPLIQKGNIGMAFQQEFGLYPTAKARKKRKKETSRAVPMELEKALRLMEQS